MGCCPSFVYHKLHNSYCGKWTKETAYVMQDLVPARVVKKSVYACGPIKDCEDAECIDWREEAKRKLAPIVVHDPMDRDMRGVKDFDVHWLIRGDKDAIDASSHLIVHWTRIGVGSSMEILYAWERGKRIAFVNKVPGSLSPWIKGHVHFITDSLDAAINWVKNDSVRSTT